MDHHELTKKQRYFRIHSIAHHQKYFGRKHRYPYTHHTSCRQQPQLNLLDLFPAKVIPISSGNHLSELAGDRKEKGGYRPRIIGKKSVTQVKEWLVIFVELILPGEVTIHGNCIVPAEPSQRHQVIYQTSFTAKSSHAYNKV